VKVTNSPLSNAEVKNGGAMPPPPSMSSWHSAYLIKHRDNFTFTLPIFLPRKLAQTVKLLACIWEVSDSNLDRDTDCIE
jgi:hypothetical protein